MDPVALLAALCVAFVVTHLAMSHAPLRDPLVARLGAPGFRGAYSLVSLAIWLPLAGVWWTHPHAGTAWFVWRAPLALRGAELVAALGVAMVVAGFAQPVPSSMANRAREHLEVRGLAHVTRHPVMWGTALLCLAHLPANGFTGDLWFWGTHLVLAVVGVAHQDARLAVSRPGYADYMARTTFLPNPLGLSRIGARSVVTGAVGVAAAAAVRFAHQWF